jgi:hypothetical protein
MLQSESKSAVEMANTPVPLAQAAVEVQLAVELIMLLEQQQLPPAVILAALDIVQADFRRTLTTANAEI